MANKVPEIIDGSLDKVVSAYDIQKLHNQISSIINNESEQTVSIVLKDKFMSVQFILSCLTNGLTVNPINPDLKHHEINNILTHAKPKVVISEDKYDGFNCVDPEVLLSSHRDDKSEDVCNLEITGNLLIYTSGTTGSPKGVFLSSEKINNNVDLALMNIPFGDNHTTASMLPVYHTFTLISDLLTSWKKNGKCVILPDFDISSLPLYKSSLSRYEVQSFSAVPLIFKLLNKLSILKNIESIEYVISGAAPFAISDYKEYVEGHSHKVIPCYGMTEATCFIGISTFGKNVLGSSGKPVIPLRVMDSDNNECSRNEVGEIQISGRSVIDDGYYKSDLKRDEYYKDIAWFKTGDLGYLDEIGNLFVVGRIKNMLIKGGEKVYLEDIENLLSEYDVAAKLDSQKETYVLYTTSSESKHDQIFNLIKNNLSHHHIPNTIKTIPAIPKSKTGKIKRAELSECF